MSLRYQRKKEVNRRGKTTEETPQEVVEKYKLKISERESRMVLWNLYENFILSNYNWELKKRKEMVFSRRSF
jgi:hypothetical protein